MASGSRTKNRQTKAEQARQTRLRITAAATELFIRDGFLTTTVAQIAERAGVAVQTLYLSFGGKTAILHAAFDQALVGDDDPVPVMQRDWWHEVLIQPDGPMALSTFVDNSCAVQARVGPLYGAIGAAAADPEVAELLARNKSERYDGFARVAEHLSTTLGYNTNLPAEEAADILYTVQSEEGYTLLVTERGWSIQHWHDWVLRTLRSELFPGTSPA